MKKAVQFSRTGVPSEVVELINMETATVGDDDALIDVEAAAINPSHLLTLSGNYGVQPELPAVPGAEGTGIIGAVGKNVTNVQVGDRVMIPPYTGTWRQQVVVKAADIAVKFPSEGDPIQMAMIMANPPTSWLLLKTVVDLEPGDWVIQNAGNSAVGQYVMQLAKIYGFRTVNVVRRDGLEDFIAKAGGDICAVDGPDLGERVKAATGGADIKLAIDAVAGESTQHLADCLVDGGTIANYGLLSKKPCQLWPDDIIFREITLTGVWLTLWLRRYSTAEERLKVYNELAGYIADGRMHAAVEATYPLAKIKDAVAHAMQGERNGKVVLLPNADG
ncbi:MAG: zinc-dependent alcohol dehydrogenase family protein [Alphaproteobacteria bacterium]|jgi:mitochondrial enoyl-[acyl-carrier protein] reductase / trans-2-enoyl-CoA reductase|nr:zinc-dependent alcohol dehydrogenase family protein [Alphaproteobacteria bacterium]